jgi:hypothetical protein
MVLLASVALAAAPQLRRSSNRPTIVEVGPPRAITMAQLEQEMYWNSDLQSWVEHYGYPDLAEYQEVVPQFGWADYEIRAYYLRRNQEVVFGRVASFPDMVGYPYYPGYPGLLEHYGLIKYQGPIQQDDLQRLSAARRP